MVFGLLSRRAGRPRPEPRVPEGTRVYAIGDIHGRLDLLTALHRDILADAAAAGAPRRVVVYLGDYVDRGPRTREVLDLLIERPLAGFECVHLMGNHEDCLLKFLEDPDVALTWLAYGGDTTLRSFDIDPAAAPPTGERLAWLQQTFRERLTARRERFLRQLRLSHVEGDYLFAHAGVRPGVPLEHQVPDDLMWIREPFLSSRKAFGKIVVHGHTPSDEPVVRVNRIGIDTGAVYGGTLTALVLEGSERGFLRR